MRYDKLLRHVHEVLAQGESTIVWKLLGQLVPGVQQDDIGKLVQGIARSRDTARYLSLSNVASQHLHAGDYKAFIRLYPLASLLRKYPFQDETITEKDRKSAALTKWWASEKQCKRANRRLRYYRSRGYRLRDDTYLLMEDARQIVANILGNSIPHEFIVGDEGRFGPGMTLCSRSPDRTTPYYKYANRPYSCTVGAKFLAKLAIACNEQWVRGLDDRPSGSVVLLPEEKLTIALNSLKLVDANRVTFVPKDAKTLRSIAIEPHMNVYLQLGVDAWIRTRLKRVGIDLDNQAHNQDAAKRGSLGSEHGLSQYSTIDLSAASDTLSIELVRWLLPENWFDLLDDLRCQHGIIEGQKVRYEKFSSMGNGFTFAVESLIFYALAQACARRYHSPDRVLVYGDDIIVTANIALRLIQLLNFCGFKTNVDKTFILGPFKESCGTDWLSGVNVRPLLIKQPLRSISDVFYLRNAFQGTAGSHSILANSDKASSYLEKLLPDAIRFYGPRDANPTTVLHSDYRDVYGRDSIGWDSDISAPTYVSCVWKARTFAGANRFQYLQFLEGQTRSQRGAYRPPDALDILSQSSSGNITRRHHASIRVKRRVASNW